MRHHCAILRSMFCSTDFDSHSFRRIDRGSWRSYHFPDLAFHTVDSDRGDRTFHRNSNGSSRCLLGRGNHIGGPVRGLTFSVPTGTRSDSMSSGFVDCRRAYREDTSLRGERSGDWRGSFRIERAVLYRRRAVVNCHDDSSIQGFGCKILTCCHNARRLAWCWCSTRVIGTTCGRAGKNG